MTTNTDLHVAMPELLPCPFCGDDGEKGRQTVTQMNEAKTTFDRILCRCCGAMAPELNWQSRAAIQQAAVPADQLKEIVLDIRQHIAQGVASEAVEAKRRPGYGTGIYTYLKHKMDDISAMLAASPAPTKQQPALGRGEGGGVPLTTLAELGKRYSLDFASPHHMTFSVEGLRQLIRALASAPSPSAPTGQINPDSAGQGMEVGV